VSDMYFFLTFLYSRLNPSGQMMTGVHKKTFRSHGSAFATFLVDLIRIHSAIRDSNSELLTTYTDCMGNLVILWWVNLHCFRWMKRIRNDVEHRDLMNFSGSHNLFGHWLECY
jgi:hypothetical protein